LREEFNDGRFKSKAKGESSDGIPGIYPGRY
jgi:hypothetical protein